MYDSLFLNFSSLLRKPVYTDQTFSLQMSGPQGYPLPFPSTWSVHSLVCKVSCRYIIASPFLCSSNKERNAHGQFHFGVWFAMLIPCLAQMVSCSVLEMAVGHLDQWCLLHFQLMCFVCVQVLPAAVGVWWDLFRGLQCHLLSQCFHRAGVDWEVKINTIYYISLCPH